MKNKKKLFACLDANVIISAIGCDGVSAQVLKAGFAKAYKLVTGPTILREAERNLITKLGRNKSHVLSVLNRINRAARKYTPHGKIIYITYEPDNLVLETAIKGGAHVLVTGDKEDLLPLKEVKGVIIEPPRAFLARLKAMKLI